MTYTLLPHAVRLDFEGDSLARANLSGAAFSGDWLWVVSDEAASVELLQRQARPQGDAQLHCVRTASFALSTLLDMPGEPDDEADLEGLAVCDGWLWLVGSHGLKRKNAKGDKDDQANAKRLTQLKLDGNRRVLACVPIEIGDDGTPRLVREASDGRCARRLKGDVSHNALIDVLADDPHVAPFLKIPGKDNGFDIEGMAVDGNRLLLGLRGPVLRGWTLVLEIAVEAQGRWLRLAPLDEQGTLLRKHFLQLGGLGVRDLCFDGEDLLVLAGPTMVLDGAIRLFRWTDARTTLRANLEPVRFQEAFAEPIDLPHLPGGDRAEAVCQVPDGLVPGASNWLVLYDAPGPQRQLGAQKVLGDLLRRNDKAVKQVPVGDSPKPRRAAASRSRGSA